MDLSFQKQIIILVLDKALIGGIFVVIGFGFNHILERFKYDLGLDASRRGLAAKSQIEFKERQLAEFYGPIYALLKGIRPIDDIWNKEKLGDVDNTILEVIRDSNDRIVDIILNKSHLIRGVVIPESYTRFLIHVAVWHAFWETPDRNWSDYAQLREAQYDMEFEREIFITYEDLKQELDSLYQEYGLLAQRWKSKL